MKTGKNGVWVSGSKLTRIYQSFASLFYMVFGLLNVKGKPVLPSTV